MRESIGSTWILQLVIVFILLFVSFLTLSLSYSKSYKVKNETLSIIEKYEGVTEDAVTILNNFLEYNNYTAKGSCPDSTWVGAEDLSVKKLYAAEKDKKYYYCIKKRISKNKKVYYEIKTFFKFNLPIVGDFATFTLEGTTSDITSVDNYQKYN